MKQSTLKKYIGILTDIKRSGLSIKSYCDANGICAQSIYGTISKLKQQHDEESEMVSELLSLYNEVTSGRPKDNINFYCRVEDLQQEPPCSSITTSASTDEANSEEDVETDDTAETSYIRGDDGKIKFYKYQIFRRNKAPLCGKLTREEMNTIHRLYSYYGDALTQRVISRHFVDLSLIDFKRILRAFNITKASAPFAPHMIEECTENELRDIQLREKENSFLRKAEEDQIKNDKKLLKKYAQENIELKNQLKDLSNFQINITEQITPVILPEYSPVGQSINLYLSDLHLGASVTTGTLYQENIEYGFEEAKRRLTKVLEALNDFDCFDNFNLILLGDNIDCCGFTGKTARLDHIMPENMDAREQGNKFIELMMWFIDTLASVDRELISKLRVFSVPCGNHGGTFEYMCNKALMAYINAKYPNVETTLWEEFFGVFQQGDHTFVCCHGKDDQYMKKGLPLNLDEKSKVMLYEWLNDQKIYGDNIHIVKGDLHSNSLNSCKRLDYRNVLSLFGASDYSNYNFSRNSYGVSYDLFIGEHLVRGTFENMQYASYLLQHS